MVAGRPAQRDDQDPGHRRRACPRSPRPPRPGISVNVTLIFALDRYDEVMDAYLDRAGAGQGQRASTCPRSARSPRSSSPGSTPRSTSGWTRSAPTRPRRCAARPAIANARLAYERYEKVFGVRPLAGARRRPARNPQRPLWASTGVKDPAYDDTMYVVELVAPDTVNTMPEATLRRGRRPRRDPRRHDRRHLRRGRSRCSTDCDALGIDYDDVVEVLEAEGVQKFEDSYAQLPRACRSSSTPPSA